MICHCGASCRTSDTKEGEVHTCPKCGRREVIKPAPMRLVPPGRNIFNAAFESEPGTMEMFEKTVSNLLTMPPMPRKRKKA